MSSPSPSTGLWRSEADLAARLAELAKTGLPLPEGLKALAEEVPRRLRRPLRQLAECIVRGDDLGAAVYRLHALPEPLGVMLLSGISQGRLPEVLEEYARLEGIQTELRRQIRFSLAYPTLLMAFLTVLSFFLCYFVTLKFRGIFFDFQVELPPLTLFVLCASRWLPWIFAGVTLALFLLPLTLSGMIFVRGLAPIVYRIPIFGPLWTTLKMSQLTSWMRIFLTGGAPLPQALRLTAAGLNDGYYSPACRRIAADIEQGRPLSGAALARLPTTLIPILEWGERTNALPEAFSVASEMYDGRARLRSSLVESVLSPLFLVMFLVFVGTWILGLFLPLISLISSLSGGGHH
jgi:type II secretory pathway component PulF